MGSGNQADVSRWWKYGLPALVFLAGFLGIVPTLVAHGHVPGDVGDSRFNLYVLEHFYRALTGKDASFLSAPFFYPWPYTISFSDTHWGDGLFYVLPRLAGLQPVPSFLFWFSLSFVLNYWAFFGAARAFELHVPGAAIGAFLFAFSLPVLAQENHTQLMYRVYVPLAALLFHKALHSRQPLFLALTCLLVGLQLLTSLYIGIFLAYFLIAYFAAWIIENGRARPGGRARDGLPGSSISPAQWALPGAILVLGAGIFLLVALPYYRVHALYGFHHSWSELQTMLPRPESYLFNKDSRLWFSQGNLFARLPAPVEHQLFIGVGAVLALACAFLTGAFAGHRVTRLMLGALVFLFVLTLLVGKFSLYVVVASLPGLDSIRAVTRIILVMMFPIAMVAGRAIDVMSEKTPATAFLAVAVCALILCDSIFSFKQRSTAALWAARIASLQARMPEVLPDKAVLVVASGEPFYATELDAMLVAQERGISTLNGYSGNAPPGWRPMKTCDDVAKVVAAAQEFHAEKRIEQFPLHGGQMVYVGFGPDCLAILAAKGVLPR